MSLLESRTKFAHGPIHRRPMSADMTSTWTTNQTYRTSYSDMANKTPTAAKAFVVPGYAGYVPGMKANNMVGRSLSQTSRNCLVREDRMRKSMPVVGGWIKACPMKKELLSTSSKFGGTTIVKPDLSLNSTWTTTSRLSFRQPGDRSRPNIRDKSRGADCPKFDSTMVRNLRENCRASGFSVNYQTGDGRGLVPERNLHAAMNRTTYRVGFNCEKPFHKTMKLYSDGRLPLKAVALDQDWKQKTGYRII